MKAIHDDITYEAPRFPLAVDLGTIIGLVYLVGMVRVSIVLAESTAWYQLVPAWLVVLHLVDLPKRYIRERKGFPLEYALVNYPAVLALFTLAIDLILWERVGTTIKTMLWLV